MPNKQGFTLIELLIVIGIIAILASAVIVAINPGQQFAAARDATREQHINSLQNSLLSYQISNQGWGDLEITDELTEICNTNDEDVTCGEDLADLSDLVNDGHINQIPVDPQATGDGTGYYIAKGSVILVAGNRETRFIGAGVGEDNVAFEDNVPTLSSNEEEGEFSCGDDLTDDRNGQTYATVEINEQCWMAENLNIGEMLTELNTPEDNGTIEKYCYDDDDSNCDAYGGLYYWEEAMQYVTEEPNQGICPDGWRIPTDGDWHTLENYLTADGNDCDGSREDSYTFDCKPAGGELKEAGTSHWDSETCGTATCNSSGFTARAGGMRLPNGLFRDLKTETYWWSSADFDPYSKVRKLMDSSSGIARDEERFTYASSVRCLKD